MSDQLFEMSAAKITLADRFGFVPFSVLDTRQGDWQDRKRRWLALGLRSELGRGEDLLNLEGTADRKDRYTLGALPANQRQLQDRGYKARDAYAASNVTGAAPLPEWANNGTAQVAPGTSIFDPVLCELAYRWWAPANANILDPFAGGSVRGLVASHLGHRYTGVDLSYTQIKANHDNAREVGVGAHAPTWHAGDSRNIVALAGHAAPYNMLLTCPPYADLEVYSDDPADISTLGYPEFIDAYRAILHAAASLLERNSFLVIVVSEVRDPAGHYRGLVPDTTRIMHEAECWLYNEAILINMVGTLALRTSRNFPPGRKLGRTHQNVLVYVKGDGMTAARKCAPLEDV